MRRIKARGRARGEALPIHLLNLKPNDRKGIKMEYSQDTRPLQTSLLHEFVTVSVESVIFIMIVMIMIW